VSFPNIWTLPNFQNCFQKLFFTSILIVHPPTSWSSQWSLSFWLSHQCPIFIPRLLYSCYMPYGSINPRTLKSATGHDPEPVPSISTSHNPVKFHAAQLPSYLPSTVTWRFNSLIQQPATGRDPGPVTSSSGPHNLCLSDTCVLLHHVCRGGVKFLCTPSAPIIKRAKGFNLTTTLIAQCSIPEGVMALSYSLDLLNINNFRPVDSEQCTLMVNQAGGQQPSLLKLYSHLSFSHVFHTDPVASIESLITRFLFIL
jgi:hypothetical protein